MSKYNLSLFMTIIAAITWNMFMGNLLLAIVIAGAVLAIGVFIGWEVNWYEE